MKADLLQTTAMLPAAVATARAIGGAAALPRATVPLPAAHTPKPKARRYLTAGGEEREIVHHAPITRKTREAHEAYLVRYAAEVREQLERQGLAPGEVEARVAAAVAAPPQKLDRPVTGRTKVRGTALVRLP